MLQRDYVVTRIRLEPIGIGQYRYDWAFLDLVDFIASISDYSWEWDGGAGRTAGAPPAKKTYVVPRLIMGSITYI